MNQTVLITGASKGIGAATAILFAQKGYRVIINYNRSFESASLLARSLSARGLAVSAIKADVSSFSEVQRMVREIEVKFGRLDICINNAGIAYQGLITETPDEISDRIFDVNLKGVYNGCKAVTPIMVSQKSGCIINVSSMWGQVGASCEVAYSAAKAGVIGLTKALAKELAPSGIRVNCVAPGLIDTAMNENISVEDLNDFTEDIPLGRMGRAEEIAQAIYYLSSPDAGYITGQILGINGGVVI